MQRCTITLFLALFGLTTLDFGTAQPPKPGVQPGNPRVDAFGDPLPDGAFARLGTTRHRHGGMDLLGFTQDGKALIYHGGGAISLMDAMTGKQLKSIRYGEPESRMVRFERVSSQPVLSGDTKTLAVPHFDMARFEMDAILVFDTETGKERKRFAANELFKNMPRFIEMLQVALTEDGKWLLVFSNGARGGDRVPVAWFDTTSGERLHEMTPEKDSQFTFAQFSKDKRHVLVTEQKMDAKGGKNGGETRLRIMDAARGTEIRSVEMPANNRLIFDMCPDGQTLLANDRQGGPVRLYDYMADKQLKEIRVFSDPGPGGTFVQSADGKQLFILGRSKIYQWEINTGKEIRQIEVTGVPQEDPRLGNPFGRVQAAGLALSRDGKRVAFSGQHGVTVFDTASGKSVAGGGNAASVGGVRFNPNGKEIVVASVDQSVSIWPVGTAKTGKPLPRFVPENKGRPREIDYLITSGSKIAFTPDGKFLAVDLGDSGVGVWDAAGKQLKRYGVEPQKEEAAFGPQMGMGLGFAFSPRGHVLGMSFPNGVIKVWDVARDKLLNSWNWQKKAPVRADPRFSRTGTLTALAFSPDGKTLAGGFTDNVPEEMVQTELVLWEASSGKERLRVRLDFKGALNSGLLETVILLYDQIPLSLGFSPDGKHLLLSSFTGVHLLDAATGKDVVSYASRGAIRRSATFSPDGKLLYVGLLDGGLRVLDSATGRVVRDFPAHSEPIAALALSSDGKALASGSNDSTVLLWDVADLAKPQPASNPKLSPKELEKLWAVLADTSDPGAGIAFKAIHALASSPAEALPFIKARLKPIAPADPKVVAKLVDDLNSEKFAEREKATKALEVLGDLAKDALEQRRDAKPPLEMQQRIGKLLTKLEGAVESPQLLQAIRGIEALQHMGTPEARAHIEALAKGAAGHRITVDAQHTLDFITQAKKR